MQYLNPLNWFRWAGQFAAAWITSIQWRASWASLPAFITMVLMFAGSLLAIGQSDQWRDRMVDRRMSEAERQEDFATVDLLLQRRLRQEPENEQLMLKLAYNQTQLENHELANEQFETLALLRKNGDAARWLLKQHYSDPEDRQDWSEEKRDMYGQLTAIAAEKLPQDRLSNALRADYLIMAGRPREAIPYIEPLVASQPLRALDIAKIYKATGDDKNASEVARQAGKMLSDRLLESPADVALRVGMAQLLIFEDKYVEAIRLLEQGIQQTNDARLRPLIAQAMVLYSNELQSNSPDVETLRLCLKLVERASNYAPADPSVMRAISDIVMSTMDQDDQQVAALKQSLLAGANPGIVHFVKGTVAMLEDRVDDANRELELAYRELPNSAAILNNLAVAKSTAAKEKDDASGLEDSLKLVQKAIEIAQARQTDQTQLPFYIETRGQIYLAQAKYVEAVSDLEKVLSVPQLQRSAHRGLAEAYKQLGQADVAQLHAEAAE